MEPKGVLLSSHRCRSAKYDMQLASHVLTLYRHSHREYSRMDGCMRPSFFRLRIIAGGKLEVFQPFALPYNVAKAINH